VALTSTRKKARSAAKDARSTVKPAAEVALERIGSATEQALSSVASTVGPALEDARDRLAPAVEDARVKMAPVVAGAVATSRRKGRQVAERAGIVEERKKSHKLRNFVLLLGLGGAAAFVYSKLTGKDADPAWTASRDSA